MSNGVKVINNGGSLSEQDLQLLAGTNIIINMMRNRIIVVASDKNHMPDWTAATENFIGLYHIRALDKANLVYQVWFESAEDKLNFEKSTFLNKLAEA